LLFFFVTISSMAQVFSPSVKKDDAYNVLQANRFIGNMEALIIDVENINVSDTATIVNLVVTGTVALPNGSITKPMLAEGAVTLASAGGATSLVVDGSGPDMSVRGLTAGANVVLTQNANDIVIAAAAGAATTLTSAGGAQTLVNDGTGPDLAIAGLTAGAGVSLTPAGVPVQSVTIANTDPGSAVSLASVGAGAVIVNDSTGPSLAVKSFTRTNNVLVTDTATEVNVNVPGIVVRDVNGDYPLLVGQPSATGTPSLAIGHGSAVAGNSGIAIGNSCSAGTVGLALGGVCNASGFGSIAIGRIALTPAPNAIAIGADTPEATLDGAIAIGAAVKSTAVNATALGTSSVASATAATALGPGTDATDVDSTAVGSGAQATGLRSLAIGRNATASGAETISIGQGTASGTASMLISFGPFVNTVPNSFVVASNLNTFFASRFTEAAIAGNLTTWTLPKDNLTGAIVPFDLFRGIACITGDITLPDGAAIKAVFPEQWWSLNPGIGGSSIALYLVNKSGATRNIISVANAQVFNNVGGVWTAAGSPFAFSPGGGETGVFRLVYSGDGTFNAHGNFFRLYYLGTLDAP
jgi:hypothetical protein